MTRTACIEIIQAQPNGIVWAAFKGDTWATTGYAVCRAWSRKANPVTSLLRLISGLATRLNALSLVYAAAEGIMEAVNEAALGDGDWHKDPDICRENLAGRY
jgi:hypothetical protein